MADPGNHAPSGKHYNLQLHGVPAGQDGEGHSEDDKANGGNIWIPLDGKCDIGLREGDFQVTDRSCGFDGDRAEFELPHPDPRLQDITIFGICPGHCDEKQGWRPYDANVFHRRRLR